MAALVWETPQGRQVRQLDRTLLILGRDPASDLCIEEASISRRHLLLQVEGAAVRVTDLGSTTGTRINGALLTPDLPSTLVVGDLIHVGRVLLTFCAEPAPAPPREAKAAEARAAPAAPPVPVTPAPTPRHAPAPRRVLAAARQPPAAWRKVALGLAVLVVALLGAVGALLTADHGPTRAIVEVVERPAPVADSAPPPDAPPPERAPPPAAGPAEPAGPRRAAAGALPPSIDAPLDACPDLIEIDGARHAPFAVSSWDDVAIEGAGADGLVYSIARGRVSKIESRADAQRRARGAAARLAPEEVEGRVALAAWCARRLLVADATRLAREALRLRPGHPAARELLSAMGER